MDNIIRISLAEMTRHCKLVREQTIRDIDDLGTPLKYSEKEIESELRTVPLLHALIATGCAVTDHRGEWPSFEFADAIRKLKKQNIDTMVNALEALERLGFLTDRLALAATLPEAGLETVRKSSREIDDYTIYYEDIGALCIFTSHLGSSKPPWKDNMREFNKAADRLWENVRAMNAGPIKSLFTPFGDWTDEAMLRVYTNNSVSSRLTKAYRFSIELTDNLDFAEEQIRKCHLMLSKMLYDGKAFSYKFTLSDLFHRGKRLIVYTPAYALPHTLVYARAAGLFEGEICEGETFHHAGTTLLLPQLISLRTTGEDEPEHYQGSELIQWADRLNVPYKVLLFEGNKM